MTGNTRCITTPSTHPPSSNQTIQGDLIVRMEMDPKFAERTMAEIMVSTMTGAIEARPREQVRGA